MVGRGTSLDGGVFLGGTDGSNPVRSGGSMVDLRLADPMTADPG